MSMHNQEVCSFSELKLLKRPAIQRNILNGKFEKIYRITKLENFVPVEFLIEDATDHFLERSFPETKIPKH